MENKLCVEMLSLTKILFRDVQ